jgi:hypothetical protein
MAKAQFHKNQRVWVECVGAWATIERIVPVWAKGFDEPVRISYEVGLGREFAGNELEAERPDEAESAKDLGSWRLLRAKNKWQTPDDCSHHPFPGTYPVVVTDQTDWGGWRVPGAEYDRDPHKIEFQARLIAAAPKLMQLTEEMIAVVAESPEDAAPVMVAMARKAEAVLRSLLDAAAPPWRGTTEPAAAQPRAPAAAAAGEPRLRAVDEASTAAPAAAAAPAKEAAPQQPAPRGEDVTARLRQRLQRFTA